MFSYRWNLTELWWKPIQVNITLQDTYTMEFTWNLIVYNMKDSEGAKGARNPWGYIGSMSVVLNKMCIWIEAEG